MTFLIDTNVILRTAQPAHPMCADALNALGILRQQGNSYHLTSQNLIEFWRTCTRPIDRNGLGMSVFQADSELTRLESFYSVLPDTPDIYNEWRHLVVTYNVMGVNVHDARLVAAMRVYGLTHILTFNISDFARYLGITAVHPSEI